jgi:hypothetical protein
MAVDVFTAEKEQIERRICRFRRPEKPAPARRPPDLDDPDLADLARTICGLESVPATLAGLRTVEQRYRQNSLDFWECVRRMVYGPPLVIRTICWVKALRSIDPTLEQEECRLCSRCRRQG